MISLSYIKITYDRDLIAHKTFKGHVMVYNKVNNKERAGWTFEWFLNGAEIGKTAHVLVKNFKANAKGLIEVKVVATLPGVGMRTRTMFIYTRKGKRIQCRLPQCGGGIYI